MHDSSLRILVALARYHEIIDTPDSGKLDFDTVDPNSTKPTKAAIRVNDLIEAITGQWISFFYMSILKSNEKPHSARSRLRCFKFTKCTLNREV